jgi:hypothetical protein
MATGEQLQPGVEVIQTFQKAAPTFTRPTLVPCVVGPAFEVLNVISTDGTINSRARYGAYNQLGKALTESSFPDPRENIDELDILENTVRPFLLFGGNLTELFMSPGTSFLASSHVAGKAAIQSVAFGGGSGLDLKGKVLVIALDNPVRTDLSKDVTIVFVGTGADAQGNLTSQDAADQINSAVGKIVATVVTDKVQLASPTFGALSSVTVRAGGTANSVLQIGYSGSSAAHEERVEGCGYRGQDDKNNDTITPWIEFYTGDYLLDGVTTAIVAKAGLIDIITGAFTSAKHSAVTFGGANPTVPLQVGDYVFVDGMKLKGGEVMKVEVARFKIGTVNTALSIADEDGRYTTKVYDSQQVGTAYDVSAFAPKYVYFVANGIDWRKAAPTAAKLTGAPQTPPSAAAAASVKTTSAGAGPFNLTGKDLRYIVTVDGVDTEDHFTFTGQLADVDAVAAALGSNIAGVVATNAAGELQLATVKTGRLQGIVVKADGLANGDLGFSTGSDTSSVGKDVEYADLTGKGLKFQLNGNPHIYQVTLTSDSLDVAIDEVNALVGTTVASKDGAGTHMVLTSTLKGAASQVAVLDSGTTQGEEALGLSTTPVFGTGRPLPDAYLDDASVLHIGAELLRDQVTGLPLDQASNTGTLYIQYRALRKDVSASAKVADVLRLSDVDTLSSVLDPLTEDNPLGLGLYLCMVAAPNFEVLGLGIDELSPGTLDGTGPSWARAAALLESKEVYAIAPLTQDEVVHQMWITHCQVMSDPTQGGERIVFIARGNPTRQNPKVAVSGTKANSTAQQNQMLLDTNPASGLVALQLNPAQPFTVDDGVYLETTVAGEVERYCVSSVSGSLVNFKTSFAAGENVDGFFSDVALTVPVVDAAYSLKARGAELAIPGSNPVRFDYGVMADTVAEANASIGIRRAYSIFPDTIKTTVQGLEKSLPSYYAAAGIVGQVGALPPQQGHTNYPIPGFTGVVGTEKFTKKQLNRIAGGGTFILMQEVQGGAVFCRHQLSTDSTSIETRELSITKIVDFVSKFLRTGVRKFIGKNNINPNFLDLLGTTVHAILKFLEASGVLNGSNINNIAQDKDNPDTVLIDVTLDLPYPCNYIRLTLVV